MSNKRIRKNVILPETTIKRGKQLAKHDQRSFSGTLAAAVDEAHKRTFGIKDRELATK